MARKKVTKVSKNRKVSRKRAVKKVSSNPVKKVAKKPVKKLVRTKRPLRVRSTKKKIILVLTRLVFFIVLSLISFLSYYFLANEVLRNLFLMLTIIFSFISVGFLIALLVFVFMRVIRK